MSRYNNFVNTLEKRGRIFMAFTALLMLLSITGILKVKIQTGFDIFIPTTSKYVDSYKKMNSIFGESDQLLLLISADKDPNSLKLSADIAESLSNIEGVNSAMPPVPREIVNNQNLLKNYLSIISKEGELSLYAPKKKGGYWVTIRINFNNNQEIPKVLSKIESVIDSYNIEYILSGEPYLQGKIFDYILRILIFLPPAAIFLLIIVFRSRIGSLRATMLSMVPAILGGVITLGTVSWILGEISIMTVLIPIFIIVLGSADGLHVTSHVIDRLNEGASNKDAISETLKAVGIPIIMTTLTTMAGFLSMLIIDSQAIRQMGIGAALGIIVAGIATWIVLPILLLHQKPLKVNKKREGEGKILGFFNKIQGKPSIIITIVLVIISVPGLLKLHSDFSMLSVYKENTEVRKSIDLATEALGGSIPITVIFPAKSPLDMDSGNAILELQNKAKAVGLSNRSLSLYSTVENFVKVETGSDKIPENSNIQKVILNKIQDINPGIISNFYSDKGWGRSVFFLVNLDNSTISSFLELINDINSKNNIVLEPVGSAFSMKEMNDKILPQLLQSLLLAIAIVIILTSITQKSIMLGLLSGIPIAITLIGLFGFMGYANIELSIISGIMSTMTVGVGIDYAIHYVSLYRYSKIKSDKPANLALGYVATPIIANAMGLSIGFTVMMLSPFRIHMNLSLLMWVTMLLSSFFSLSVLPTMLGIKKEKVL